MAGGNVKRSQELVINDENAGFIANTEPDPQLIPLFDNPYVANIHHQKIFYNKDFYVAMYKRIHDEHMTYVEAYESLGFSVAQLGKTRAEQAGKKAMEKARQNKLFTVDPSSYDGSMSLDEMPNLSPEEERAYMKARIVYLESMVEAQKKIPSLLEDIFTSSKKNPEESTNSP